MKLWIARDKSGELYLYNIKPEEHEEYFVESSGHRSFPLDDDLFLEVTFENSPQKVELKLASTGSDRGKRDSIIRGLKQLEHDYMLSYEEEIDWINKLVTDYETLDR